MVSSNKMKSTSGRTVSQSRKSRVSRRKPSVTHVERSIPKGHTYTMIDYHVNLTPSGKNASLRREEEGGFYKIYNTTFMLYDETAGKDVIKSGTIGRSDYIDSIEGHKNVLVLLKKGETGTVRRIALVPGRLFAWSLIKSFN